MAITRRGFLKGAVTVAGGGILASCSPAFTPAATASPTGKIPAPSILPAALTGSDRESMLFIGAYAKPEAPGLHRYRLDPSTSALEFLESSAVGANPSFLAFHPASRFLYAVNESAPGLVSAFSLDPSSGRLTFLNWQSSRGDLPCHLATDREGKFLFVTNYLSGSVVVYALGADGRIGATLQTIQHQGKSVPAARPEGPHPHCVTVSANNRFVLCCDLGLDKVIVYQLDPGSGQLTPGSEAALAPGAGPRHLAFHPTERFAYVINELNSTMTVFAFDAGAGSLTELQTLSTLPEGYADPSAASGVSVHPSGKFAYGSNRGHNSIVLYSVDALMGTLTLVEHTPTQGKTPRHFAVSPSGTVLLVGNQNSDTVTTFRLDPATGRLTDLDQSVKVPQPACLHFWGGGSGA